MAKTYFEYPGDGVRTVYPVSFTLGYLQKSDVYVFVGTDPTIQVNYSWQDSSTVELDAAPAVGTTLTIRRIAKRNGAINDYQDGAVLKERNLDTSFAQGLMIDEELEDGFATDVIQQQDMNFGGNHTVTNLKEPVETTDAVTKGYTDNAVQVVTNAATALTNRVTTVEQTKASTVYVDAADSVLAGRLDAIDNTFIAGDTRYVETNYKGGSADGGELALEVPYQFEDIQSLYINGVFQSKGIAYYANKSTQLVELAEALNAGDEVVIKGGVESEKVLLGINGDTTYIEYNYKDGVADGGELELTVPYNFETINRIYINGVRQTQGLAWDADTGTQIIELAEELLAGDEVIIEVGLNAEKILVVAGLQKDFASLTEAVAFFVDENPLYPLYTPIHTASYRSKDECDTLSIVYPDGGGADYVVEVLGTPDGYGDHEAGSNQLSIVPSRGEVTAESFGAYSGGVVSSNVQAVIDYAVLKKLNITSKKSTFLVSGVSSSGYFNWESPETTLLAVDAASDNPLLLGLTYSGQDKMTISLSFDGNESGVSTFNNVVQTYNARNIDFDKCKWESCLGIGLLNSGATNVNVKNSRLLNCGIRNRTTSDSADRRQGIAYTGGGLNNTVIDTEGVNIGLDVVSFASGEVNCKAIRVTTDSNDAGTIYISNADGFEVSGCNIQNGIGGGNGIDIVDSKNGVVTKNINSMCGASGILVAGDSSSITLSNNILFNNDLKKAGTTHRGAITIYNLSGDEISDITLSGNICYDDRDAIDVTQRYSLDVACAGTCKGLTVESSNNFKGYSSSGNRDDTNVYRQNLTSNDLGAKDLMLYKNFATNTSTLVCSTDVSGIFEFTVNNNGAYSRLKIATGAVTILDDTAGTTATSDSGTGIAVYDDGAGRVVIKNRTGLTRTIQMHMNTTVRGS
jgi:hypothetical protein